ncbi:MAG: SsrA-binding protein SmpB [Nitrososphaerota archaeon]
MIIFNRKAGYDYYILEKLEAGIELTGAEIKSIRAGRVSLYEAYVKFINNEAFLINAYIHPWTGSEKLGIDPRRTRKLLLHRSQINNWQAKLKSSNLTVVPLAIYFKNGLVKLEIALARAKKKHEKKEILKRKVIEREIERELKAKS